MIEYDDLEFEGQEDPETEYYIDPMDANEKKITYGFYGQLSTLSNFYSRIQNNYKKVAITWLIASFIAMEFVFSQEAKLPLDITITVLFINFATMFGITLLWYIDIKIYQTLFYGVLVEEVLLEKTHEWLPKTYTALFTLDSDSKTNKFESYYYIGCQNISLLVMCLTLLSLFHFNLLPSLVIVASFILISFVLGLIMMRGEHPKKISPLKKVFYKIFKKKYHRKINMF
jgi:hypothetical protein